MKLHRSKLTCLGVRLSPWSRHYRERAVSAASPPTPALTMAPVATENVLGTRHKKTSFALTSDPRPSPSTFHPSHEMLTVVGARRLRPVTEQLPCSLRCSLGRDHSGC